RCSAPSATASPITWRRRCRTATPTAYGAGTDRRCVSEHRIGRVERQPEFHATEILGGNIPIHHHMRRNGVDVAPAALHRIVVHQTAGPADLDQRIHR